MLIRLVLAALLACALFVPTHASAQDADANLTRAKRILRTTPLVDGHNDLAWRIREDKHAPSNVEAYDLRKTTPGQTDLARIKEGMLGAQFWSVYIPGEIKDSGYARVQLEEIDIARRFIAKYPSASPLRRVRRTSERTLPRARSPPSLAWKVATRSRTRSAPCVRTTTWAFAT